MKEVFVDDPQQLQQLCEELSTESVLALDTEFLREKTYYAQLCLVQIATPTLIACIDPIQITDISPFLTISITGAAILTLAYLLRPIRSFLRIADNLRAG